MSSQMHQSSGAESRGGCPGLSVLMSLTVSVDVKQQWTMLRHWSQFVPNMSTQHPRTWSSKPSSHRCNLEPNWTEFFLLLLLYCAYYSAPTGKKISPWEIPPLSLGKPTNDSQMTQSNAAGILTDCCQGGIFPTPQVLAGDRWGSPFSSHQRINTETLLRAVFSPCPNKGTSMK